MSSAYHPQTDVQKERVNGVTEETLLMEETLRHSVGPQQNDWDDLLALAEFSMNNSWHHFKKCVGPCLDVGFDGIYDRVPPL